MTRIVTPFPDPPEQLTDVLTRLGIRNRGDTEEMAAPGNLSAVPIPWELARCPNPLREAIWRWCDEVAAWLNHEYVWHPTKMIPPCWPRHPHIARELPNLAILRWQAEQSPTLELMEEWHRYALPNFSERMLDRLGEGGCRSGRHVAWPAAAGYAAFISDAAIEQRTIAIEADLGL
jgi:hypothetical protein